MSFSFRSLKWFRICNCCAFFSMRLPRFKLQTYTGYGELSATGHLFSSSTCSPSAFLWRSNRSGHVGACFGCWLTWLSGPELRLLKCLRVCNVRIRYVVCNRQVEPDVTPSAALVSALQAKITALTLENQQLASNFKVRSPENKKRLMPLFHCPVSTTRLYIPWFWVVDITMNPPPTHKFTNLYFFFCAIHFNYINAKQQKNNPFTFFWGALSGIGK